MKTLQETARLIRLTRLAMINCFLVVEDDGFTLVDTGIPGSAHGIVQTAQRFGASIRRILLTHAHVDHVGSLDLLAGQLPGVGIGVSQRESRLLIPDFSLDPGEFGKKLFAFPGAKSRPTVCLKDADRIGSLQAVFCPGHTPGHLAFLDVRDGTLIAGDAFTTQMGVMAAGAFKFYFPFPALFSWNKKFAAESARKLRSLKPERLAVGHGKTVESPLSAMDKAIDLAFRQCGKLLH